MNILITGGAGYIGTELIYQLANNKEINSIVIYDNLSRRNYNIFIGQSKLNDKVKLVNGELLDSRNLRKHLKGIDVVFHLAAKVSTPFSDQNPHEFEQTNNWGTAELCYALEESEVKKLIYTSSVSVYGSSEHEASLNTPLNPRTFYGISKMRGEQHIERLKEKIPTYIFRCGNVYGYSKSMRFDAVINKFMFDANYNKRISINGDGNQKRSFIHIDKAVAVLAETVLGKLDAGIYNLVDQNISINDIAQILTEIYPEMEMLFVNQHLKLRQINVAKDTELNQIFKGMNKSLKDELIDFKEAFTF